MQQRLLEFVAEFAACFDCIQALYIFGSVARGETSTARDIDICVEWVEAFEDDAELRESYLQFQSKIEDWATDNADRFGRRLSVHNWLWREPEERVLDWVRGAAKTSPGRIGKAILAATPPR